MKKKIVFLFVVLSLALAACGAATPKLVQSTPDYYEEKRGYEMGLGGDEAYQYAAPMSAVVSNEPMAVDTGAAAALQERMVIMNVDMTIVVADPQVKMDEIAALAKSSGGFVVSMNLYQTYLEQGGSAPQGYISIRVPFTQLDSALEQIKANVVEVRSENHFGQDVTADYIDLQSRLKALEAARDQLQAIMDNATKTEDVLNVFNQLQYYKQQIEVTKGQMKYYEQASTYSLVTINLIAQETVKPLQIGPWTPKGAAQDAFKALVNFLRGFVEFLLWLFILIIPALIVIFGPIVLVIWLIVRAVRRKKAKKQAA